MDDQQLQQSADIQSYWQRIARPHCCCTLHYLPCAETNQWPAEAQEVLAAEVVVAVEVVVAEVLAKALRCQPE